MLLNLPALQWIADKAVDTTRSVVSFFDRELPTQSASSLATIQQNLSHVEKTRSGAEIAASSAISIEKEDGISSIIKTDHGDRYFIASQESGNQRVTLSVPLAEGEPRPTEGTIGTVYLRSGSELYSYQFTWTNELLEHDEEVGLLNQNLPRNILSGRSDAVDVRTNDRYTLIGHQFSLPEVAGELLSFAFPASQGNLHALIAHEPDAHAQQHGTIGRVFFTDSTGGQRALELIPDSGNRITSEGEVKRPEPLASRAEDEQPVAPSAHEPIPASDETTRVAPPPVIPASPVVEQQQEVIAVAPQLPTALEELPATPPLQPDAVSTANQRETLQLDGEEEETPLRGFESPLKSLSDILEDFRTGVGSLSRLKELEATEVVPHVRVIGDSKHLQMFEEYLGSDPELENLVRTGTADGAPEVVVAFGADEFLRHYNATGRNVRGGDLGNTRYVLLPDEPTFLAFENEMRETMQEGAIVDEYYQTASLTASWLLEQAYEGTPPQSIDEVTAFLDANWDTQLGSYRDSNTSRRRFSPEERAQIATALNHRLTSNGLTEYPDGTFHFSDTLEPVVTRRNSSLQSPEPPAPLQPSSANNLVSSATY